MPKLSEIRDLMIADGREWTDELAIKILSNESSVENDMDIPGTFVRDGKVMVKEELGDLGFLPGVAGAIGSMFKLQRNREIGKAAPIEYPEGVEQEQPIDETLLNDFINGVVPGAINDPNPATFKTDPLGTLAGMGGMLFGAGKFTAGARGLKALMAKQAGYMGAHGAATAKSRGASNTESLKQGGLMAALGAALPALRAIPLPIKPGAVRSAVDAVDEGLTWGGVTKLLDPDASLEEVATMAVAGPLLGKALKAPYRTRYEPLQGTPAQREMMPVRRIIDGKAGIPKPPPTEALIPFAPRPPASEAPGSMAAFEGVSTGNIGRAAEHAALIADSKPTPAFMEILESVPDLSTKHEGFLSPRTDVLQKAFGGEVTNAATREVLGTIEDIDLAQMQTESKMISEARDIINSVPSERMMKYVQPIAEVIGAEESAMSTEELLATDGVSAVVKGMSPQYARDMVEVGRQFRAYFDRWHSDGNTMLGALGEKEVPYLNYYWPHKKQLSVVEELGRANDPSSHSSAATRYRPGHTKERKGGEFKQKDPRETLDIYARDHSSLIWNNLAIKTLDKYVEAAHSAGRPNIADTIKNISDLDYGGKQDAFTRYVESGLAAAHATPLGKLAVKLSGRATEAQLGGNIGWMLTTQVSSTALTPLRVGEYSSALAGKMMADPAVRKWVGEVSYAVRAKRGGHGGTSAITQDILGVKKDLQPKNLWDHWTNMVSRPAAVIENETTVHAFLSGYISKRRMGGTHEESVAAGDDAAKKYQLIYDRKNAPGILKSPYASVMAKYQRFVFQMYNNIRESAGLPEKIPVIGKTGAFKEAAFGGKKASGPANATARRALLAAKLLGLVLMQNWAHDEITGRNLWGPSSAIPGFNLAGGSYFGKYGNYPWIVQFALTGTDALKDFVHEGDPAPLTKFLARYLVPGGSQMVRTFGGARAIGEGGVHVGDEFKPIDSGSVPKKLQMLIWGPHSTKEMRKYWDGREYIRVPVKKGSGDTAPNPRGGRSGRSSSRPRR